MMTASVNYGLQNLDDSINRTIDALNQVRLSVYGTVTPNAFDVTPGIGGLAHTAAQNAWYANPFVNPYATAILGNALANRYAALATQWGYSPYAWPTL